MDKLLSNFQIAVQDSIYIKDPATSELGKKIIQHSIQLLDNVGLEDFTFKKLGQIIGSNESSIYRYFDNKHMVLIYLTNWYWGWMEYKLVVNTHSIANGKEKLKKAVEVLTERIVNDTPYGYVDVEALGRIIMNESSKSFLTTEVDKENKEGYFTVYKRIIKRLGEMIESADSSYRYPSSLASTVIEASNHQQFLALHFPSITNCKKEGTPAEFLTDLIFKAINPK